MAPDVAAVTGWLKRRYQVETPADWLEACVEWIHSEHQSGALTQQALCSMVLEQWLLCDLREIGYRCLPPECATQQKISLTGSLCLQVNSVMDVSCPFYSQLQKLEGTENANVDVTATQHPQTQEPRAGRMLMLQMTDGEQEVRGMEYKPLSGVNVDMSPGTKVVVSGPVVCRRGVIMLTKDNLLVLGGEIDSMKENNAHLNVIKNTLANNSREDRPRQQLPRATFDGKSLSKPQQSQKYESFSSQKPVWNQNQPSNQQVRGNIRQIGSNNTHPQVNQNQPSNQQVGGNTRQIVGNNTHPQVNQNQPSNQQVRGNIRQIGSNNTRPQVKHDPKSQVTTGGLDDDDFMDDLDPAQLDALEQQWDEADPLDELLGDLSDDQLGMMVTNTPQGNHQTGRSAPRLTETHASRSNNPQPNLQASNRNSNMNRNNSNLDFARHRPGGNNTRYDSTMISAVKPIVIKPEENGDELVDRLRDQNPAPHPWNAGNVVSHDRMGPTNQGHLEDPDCILLDDDDDFDMNTSMKPSKVMLKVEPMISRPQGSLAKPSSYSGSSESKPRQSQLNVTDSKTSNTSLHSNKSESRVGNSSMKQSTLSSMFSRNPVKSEACPPQKQRRITPNLPEFSDDDLDFMDAGTSAQDMPAGNMPTQKLGHSSKGHNIDLYSSPYTYLKLIEDMWPPNTHHVVRVKAYVATLLSRLEHNEGRFWSLLVKINDGTTCMNVTLGDQLLQSLIGFSAQQCHVMKEQAKTNKAVRSKIAMGMKQCQTSLVQLSGILELELSPPQSQPVVIKLHAFTQQDIIALQHRITARR